MSFLFDVDTPANLRFATAEGEETRQFGRVLYLVLIDTMDKKG